MKFTRDISFSNYYRHKSSAQPISTPPPDEPNEGQMDVPQSLKRGIQEVMTGCWGQQIEGMQIDSYRICWYVFLCPIPSNTPRHTFSKVDLHQPIFSIPYSLVPLVFEK